MGNKLLKKYPFFIIGLIFILVQFFLLTYLNRAAFINNYDFSYWKERVEHSQWKLPLSDRIIGDDGLYSYLGYELIQGKSPDFLSAEVPPLGKYLIGFSVMLFNSPAFYGLIFGVLSLLIFYLIANSIFKNRNLSMLCVAALSVEPVFFIQLWNSWLDISQLFFLLLNLYFFQLAIKHKKKTFFALSGLSLGFFSVTKLPILLPILLILELFYLFKLKTIKSLVLYFMFIVIGVFAPYSYYFILGNSLIDFINLQKYMISFYLKSQLDVNIGSLWQILLFGKSPNLSSPAIERIQEWWIVWPIITFISLAYPLKNFFTIKKFLVVGSVLIIVFGLIVYSFIPMYVRYLILIIPFMYLLSFLFIKKYFKYYLVKIILLLMLAYGLVSSVLFVNNLSTETAVDTFSHSFSNQFFGDIYKENLLSKSRKNFSRSDFYSIAKKAMNGANVVDIEFSYKNKNFPIFKNRAELDAVLTYKTRYLGEFTEEKKFVFVKENGEWRLDWDWSYLLEGFTSKNAVDTEINPGRRGSILKEENILVEDSSGYLISVNPSRISEKEEEILTLISDISGVIKPRLHNAYTENVLPNTYIPLVTNFEFVEPEIRNKLESYEGVKLTQHRARVYRSSIRPESIDNTFFNECCTKIYSPYSYHGISGIEKKYDEELSGEDGGKILILNDKKEIMRTILEKKPINGKNITISNRN